MKQDGTREIAEEQIGDYLKTHEGSHLTLRLPMAQGIDFVEDDIVKFLRELEGELKNTAAWDGFEMIVHQVSLLSHPHITTGVGSANSKALACKLVIDGIHPDVYPFTTVVLLIPKSAGLEAAIPALLKKHHLEPLPTRE